MSDFELTEMDDPEPWDRQLAETSDEYLAFATYRNMGPKRTFAQVARELSLSPGHIQKMAADHSWTERVAAWDYYQEKIFQAELAEHTRQMARRHVEMATSSLEALRAPVDALIRKMEQDPQGAMEAFDLVDLTKLMKMVQDSAKIMPSVMSAERLATNQPTEISEHTENRNINYGDSERLGEVIDVLRTTGVLASFLGEGATGEITDAEVVEVDDGDSDAEADSLSSGSSS